MDENIINTLKSGGVVVIPTDTLYGILGRAEDERAVARIYEARKRNPEKPCIILVGDVSDLAKFSISISDKQKKALQDFWPGPVSIILDCLDEKFKYLHRGTHSLAFRMPGGEPLRNLLKQTGPLIAPSANTEGLPPSENTSEAKNYFEDLVDLYVDGGEIKGKASKVIRLKSDGSVEVLRV